MRDLGGNLMVFADEVRYAIVWGYNNARALGNDPS
jgi:hypothetical protein